MGYFSLHFDPKNPYVDHTSAPATWTFDNGTHPDKFMFSNWTYNETTRNFLGTCELDGEYFGLDRYFYNLTFS